MLKREKQDPLGLEDQDRIGRMQGSPATQKIILHILFFLLYNMTSDAEKAFKAIIRLVFGHRETRLVLPILFAEDEMLRMQNFWNEYLRSLRPEHGSSLPRNIADVISKINEWLEYVPERGSGFTPHLSDSSLELSVQKP